MCLSRTYYKQFAFCRLHFRPKTPPPDYEPPCDMLLSPDTFFNPSANMPFSMEIQTLEAPSSTLLDTSTFITDPFMFDNLDLDTPVTDTRQSSDRHIQTGSALNTLIPSVNSNCNVIHSDNVTLNDSFNLSNTNCDVNCDGDYRTIGCSRFTITDLGSFGSAPSQMETVEMSKQKKVFSSSTLTSPKFNSVSTVTTGEGRRARNNTDQNSLGNTNGLLTQFGFEGEYCFKSVSVHFLCTRCYWPVQIF